MRNSKQYHLLFFIKNINNKKVRKEHSQVTLLSIKDCNRNIRFVLRYETYE